MFAPAACALLGKEGSWTQHILSGGCVGQVSITEVRCRGRGQTGCRGHTRHLTFDGGKLTQGLSVPRPQARLVWTYSSGNTASSPATENPDSE